MSTVTSMMHILIRKDTAETMHRQHPRRTYGSSGM